jgi:hypothetical protein
MPPSLWLGVRLLARVDAEPSRREQILPAKGAIGTRVLLAEGCGEPDAAEPGLNVGVVDDLDVLDLRAERPFGPFGERDDPVLVTLSLLRTDNAS